MQLEKNLRYQAEKSKSIIYDTKNDKDICMYFRDENRDFLLKILNNSVV